MTMDDEGTSLGSLVFDAYVDLGGAAEQIDALEPRIAALRGQLASLQQAFDGVNASTQRMRAQGEAPAMAVGRLAQQRFGVEQERAGYTAGGNRDVRAGTEQYVQILRQQVAVTDASSSALRALMAIEEQYNIRQRETAANTRASVQELLRYAETMRQLQERSAPEAVEQARNRLLSQPTNVARVAGQQFMVTPQNQQQLQALSRDEGIHLGQLREIQRQYDRIRDSARDAYTESRRQLELYERDNARALQSERAALRGGRPPDAGPGFPVTGPTPPPTPPGAPTDDWRSREANRFADERARAATDATMRDLYGGMGGRAGPPTGAWSQNVRAAAQRASGRGGLTPEQFSFGLWPSAVLQRFGLGQTQWPIGGEPGPGAQEQSAAALRNVMGQSLFGGEPGTGLARLSPARQAGFASAARRLSTGAAPAGEDPLDRLNRRAAEMYAQPQSEIERLLDAMLGLNPEQNAAVTYAAGGAIPQGVPLSAIARRGYRMQATAPEGEGEYERILREDREQEREQARWRMVARPGLQVNPIQLPPEAPPQQPVNEQDVRDFIARTAESQERAMRAIRRLEASGKSVSEQAIANLNARIAAVQQASEGLESGNLVLPEDTWTRRTTGAIQPREAARIARQGEVITGLPAGIAANAAAGVRIPPQDALEDLARRLQGGGNLARQGVTAAQTMVGEANRALQTAVTQPGAIPTETLTQFRNLLTTLLPALRVAQEQLAREEQEAAAQQPAQTAAAAQETAPPVAGRAPQQAFDEGMQAMRAGEREVARLQGARQAETQVVGPTIPIAGLGVPLPQGGQPFPAQTRAAEQDRKIAQLTDQLDTLAGGLADVATQAGVQGETPLPTGQTIAQPARADLAAQASREALSDEVARQQLEAEAREQQAAANAPAAPAGFGAFDERVRGIQQRRRDVSQLIERGNRALPRMAPGAELGERALRQGVQATPGLVDEQARREAINVRTQIATQLDQLDRSDEDLRRELIELEQRIAAALGFTYGGQVGIEAQRTAMESRESPIGRTRPGVAVGPGLLERERRRGSAARERRAWPDRNLAQNLMNPTAVTRPGAEPLPPQGAYVEITEGEHAGRRGIVEGAQVREQYWGRLGLGGGAQQQRAEGIVLRNRDAAEGGQEGRFFVPLRRGQAPGMRVIASPQELERLQQTGAEPTPERVEQLSQERYGELATRHTAAEQTLADLRAQRTALQGGATPDREQLVGVQRRINELQTEMRDLEREASRGVRPEAPRADTGPGAPQLAQTEQAVAGATSTAAETVTRETQALAAESDAILRKLPLLSQLEGAEREVAQGTRLSTEQIEAQARAMEQAGALPMLSNQARAWRQAFIGQGADAGLSQAAAERRAGSNLRWRYAMARGWEPEQGEYGIAQGGVTIDEAGISRLTGDPGTRWRQLGARRFGEIEGGGAFIDPGYATRAQGGAGRAEVSALADAIRQGFVTIREAEAIRQGNIATANTGIVGPPERLMGTVQVFGQERGVFESTQREIVGLAEDIRDFGDATQRLDQAIVQAIQSEINNIQTQANLRDSLNQQVQAARLSALQQTPTVLRAGGYQFPEGAEGQQAALQLGVPAAQQAQRQRLAQADLERLITQRAAVTTREPLEERIRTLAATPEEAERRVRAAQQQTNVPRGLLGQVHDVGGVTVQLNQQTVGATQQLLQMANATRQNEQAFNALGQSGNPLIRTIRNIEQSMSGANAQSIRLVAGLLGIPLGISVVAGAARLLNDAIRTAIDTQTRWQGEIRQTTIAFGDQANAMVSTATALSRNPEIGANRGQLLTGMTQGQFFAQQNLLPATTPGGQGIGQFIAENAGRLNIIYGGGAEQAQAALQAALSGNGQQLATLTNGLVNVTPQALALANPQTRAAAQTPGLSQQQIATIWEQVFPTQAQQRAEILRVAEQQLLEVRDRAAQSTTNLQRAQQQSDVLMRSLGEHISNVFGTALERFLDGVEGLIGLFQLAGNTIGPVVNNIGTSIQNLMSTQLPGGITLGQLMAAPVVATAAAPAAVYAGVGAALGTGPQFAWDVNNPQEGGAPQGAASAITQQSTALSRLVDASNASTTATDERTAALVREANALQQTNAAMRQAASDQAANAELIQNTLARGQNAQVIGQAAAGPFGPLGYTQQGIGVMGVADTEQQLLAQRAQRQAQFAAGQEVTRIRTTGTPDDNAALDRQIAANAQLRQIEQARAQLQRGQAEAQAQLDQQDIAHQHDLLDLQTNGISRQQELVNLRDQQLTIEGRIAQTQLDQTRIQQQITIASRTNLDTERNVLLARQAQLPIMWQQEDLTYRQSIASARVRSIMANLALGRQADVGALPGLIQEQQTAGLEAQAQEPQVLEAQRNVQLAERPQQAEELTRQLTLNSLEGQRRAVEDRQMQDQLDLQIIQTREGDINRELQLLDDSREAEREKAQNALLTARQLTLQADQQQRLLEAQRAGLDTQAASLELATELMTATSLQLTAQNAVNQAGPRQPAVGGGVAPGIGGPDLGPGGGVVPNQPPRAPAASAPNQANAETPDWRALGHPELGPGATAVDQRAAGYRALGLNLNDPAGVEAAYRSGRLNLGTAFFLHEQPAAGMNALDPRAYHLPSQDELDRFQTILQSAADEYKAAADQQATASTDASSAAHAQLDASQQQLDAVTSWQAQDTSGRSQRDAWYRDHPELAAGWQNPGPLPNGQPAPDQRATPTDATPTPTGGGVDVAGVQTRAVSFTPSAVAQPSFQLNINGAVNVNSMDDVIAQANAIADDARAQAFDQARAYLANVLTAGRGGVSPTLSGARVVSV